MTKWIIVSLAGILAVASASQAGYDVLLDDFSTDTMVDANESGKNGNYQYQRVDANWVASYGNSDTPPAWAIEDGQLKVLDRWQTIRVGRIFAVDFSANTDPANWSLQFEWIAGRTDRIDDFEIYLGDPNSTTIADETVVWPLRVGQNRPAPTDELATWVQLTPGWAGGTGPLTSGDIISFGFDDQHAFDDPNVVSDLSVYTMIAVSYLHVKNNPATVLDNFRLHSASDPSGDLPGDADGDGDVDAADYIILKTNMGQASGAELANGDFDDDGDVDWYDLQLLQGNYGETSAGASGSTASSPPSGTIPEPATLGLLAVGAMVILRRRRR